MIALTALTFSSLSANTAVIAADERKTEAGVIAVTATTSNKQLAKVDDLHWTRAADKSTSSDTIDIEPSKKFQSILGFGGAFTDSTCYTFNEMPAEARKKLFHELFDPSELGLNVCRTCIGSSDYSTHAYSYDEGEPDPEMQRFSIDFDKKYILPVLREALHTNPDIFLFSTP